MLVKYIVIGIPMLCMHNNYRNYIAIVVICKDNYENTLNSF